MPTWILIGTAGALGALARYGLTSVLHEWMSARFQYVTLVINLSGTYVLAFIMEWSMRTLVMPLELRHMITVGFLASFTTFSTFSFEILSLIRAGDWWDAGTYVVLSVLGGLAFAALGIWTAQLVAR